jgi:digeranylgeranylglycerophospholipid reductase
MNDVIVVGGGPAGLYAGLQLAQAGFSVELFEEHQVAGEPVHCTGVLAREAFEEFGLSTVPILNELSTVNFYAPSGETIDYATPSVEAVVVDRVGFDQALARKAIVAGVEMHSGHRVTSVDVHPDGVRIRAGGSEGPGGPGEDIARGRVCILACGASYALQRKLGLGMPRLLLHSAQIELPAARLGGVEVHFGRNVAPQGFAWAVPVQRDRPYVRIGVMCDRGAGSHFTEIVSRLSARWGITASAVRQPRQKILPLGPIERTYGDRVIALGDAAGLVKPTTGGGIYYSLVSAALAAQTLEELLPRDELKAESLAIYERRWRRRLGSELRWQLLLRRIAQRLSDEDIDALFELARTDGIMPLVRRTAAFNHHREFITALFKHPPARRLLLRAVVV